ncbi:MAG: preprotein translocase subunit SecG [Candidatus Paceibacterota bacterium]
MSSILPYIQIFLSVILVTAILMQQTDASLGAVFGGGDSGGGGRTRRGFDKTLFKATIVIAILFALASFISFLI